MPPRARCWHGSVRHVPTVPSGHPLWHCLWLAARVTRLFAVSPWASAPGHYWGKLPLNGEMAELDETLSAGEGASFPRSQTCRLCRDERCLASTHRARPGWVWEQAPPLPRD